jgi:hypothetical protein
MDRSLAREGRNAQYPLFPVAVDESGLRPALVKRWFWLVRNVLPEMAERCQWPISRDHCFMRLCLDTAMRGIWTDTVQRPAIRHLSIEQLTTAIAVAETLVRAPESLNAFNRQSIIWRQQRCSVSKQSFGSSSVCL